MDAADLPFYGPYGHPLPIAAPLTIADRLSILRPFASVPPLPAPQYDHAQSAARREKVLFATGGFQQHMTDEGWQLQIGLEAAGYHLVGRSFADPSRDVAEVIRRYEPAVAIMQDKREWDPKSAACITKGDEFTSSDALAADPSIFRLTILKDAHANPPYHRAAADEIGAHAWICYYHPAIVAHLATYVRPQHLVRTWHSIDAAAVPPYDPIRHYGCVLSGAINPTYYPLRAKVQKHARFVPELHVHPHPGYHAAGSNTPEYLNLLSRFAVSICTSSVFGYALRKIIESTACGCRVITDLPPDDVLPGGIDGNLIRVHPGIDVRGALSSVVQWAIETYDPAVQQEYARRAREFYDYRAVGVRLAAAIESLRERYESTG